MRKIRNTTEAGLGTFIGTAEREHIVFQVGLNEVDPAKLAEAVKDPIVKGWFDDGKLVDQTNDAIKAATKTEEPKPSKAETKKDDGKK